MAEASHQTKSNEMTNHRINFAGWILFAIAAFGFCIASSGKFWTMFVPKFLLLAHLITMIPFFGREK